MARKAHVIGYRLGESRWWESRTVNSNRKAEIRERSAEYKMLKSTAVGVMKKYGRLLGSLQLEGRIRETGIEQRISMVGVQEERRGQWGRLKGVQPSHLLNGPEASKDSFEERSTVVNYAAEYLKELVEMYIRRGVEMSYREEKASLRNARIVRATIEQSSRGLLRTMRRMKREVGREMTKRQLKG